MSNDQISKDAKKWGKGKFLFGPAQMSHLSNQMGGGGGGGGTSLKMYISNLTFLSNWYFGQIWYFCQI